MLFFLLQQNSNNNDIEETGSSKADCSQTAGFQVGITMPWWPTCSCLAIHFTFICVLEIFTAQTFQFL